jgi:hydrogenase expression/formation protein HypC
VSSHAALHELDELAPRCGPGGHCITCADEGIAMDVLRVDADRALALCIDARGARGSVEIALVGEVAVGDSLLVHAGTAIARLDGRVS